MVNHFFNAHVQVEHLLEAVKVCAMIVFNVFSNLFIFYSSERHLLQKLHLSPSDDIPKNLLTIASVQCLSVRSYIKEI